MNLKNLLLFLSFFTSLLTAYADENFTYRPNVHGAIRPRWEMETETGKSRFQVRYARLTLDGRIHPDIDYFIQTDLCDQGVMKILDVYGRFRIIKGLTVQAGQFRMPFGVETFRAPQNYIFANRSFMAKQMCNYRKVGLKGAYKLPVRIPLSVEAGVFNAGGIGNHDVWSKKYAYSGKADIKLGSFGIEAGALSVRPENVRINMYDVAVTWQNANVLAAAEYMNEHYTDGRRDAHSWCAFADWHKPVSLGVFNRWSVQGRYDGITRQWNGIDSSAEMPARNRITVGSTLTAAFKAVFADVRINYEKYFYHSGVTVPEGLGDKIVAELAIRF